MEDDEHDSFRSLAAATANVVKYLRLDEQKERDEPNQERRDRKDEQKSEEQRRFLECRLREIAAFENRVNGGKRFKR